MRIGSRSMARWTALALAVALAGPAALFALTDEEIFRDFRFNLSNPGARSLGLGGAFIAVADDATSALANPAGLMLLARPEFFTEMRETKADSSTINAPVLDGSGAPIAGASITANTGPRGVFSPSFFSYVHPFKRFAVGVSRVDLNKASNVTNNTFLLPFDPNNPSSVFTISGNGQIETDLSVWNVSGAVKLTDKISFGATAAVGVLNLRSTVTNTFIDPDPNSPAFNISQILYQTAINDTDTDFSYNVGVHWRPLSNLSFGGVYRSALRFAVEETAFNDSFFGGFYSAFLKSPRMTTFNTPDVWGAGAAWRPLSALTVSLDWVHLNYSRLEERFRSAWNILNFLTPDLDFHVEDADEFHFGAEYVFSAGTIPWAVRGGAFSDHNSRIFGDFKPNPNSSGFASKEAFPARDTEIHYTVGTGVVVKDRFQIDAAADFSEIANEYVVSTIFRF